MGVYKSSIWSILPVTCALSKEADLFTSYIWLCLLLNSSSSKNCWVCSLIRLNFSIERISSWFIWFYNFKYKSYFWLVLIIFSLSCKMSSGVLTTFIYLCFWTGVQAMLSSKTSMLLPIPISGLRRGDLSLVEVWFSLVNSRCFPSSRSFAGRSSAVSKV